MSLTLLGVMSAMLLAQRELHWDELDVTARLDADGVLDVAERHTMVFTGDWNGGERVFNMRPRQRLEFLGMERVDAATGAKQALQEASVVPNNVDEYTLTDARTLRWRSRLPSDRPFANTRLTYVLHYKLSGILLKDADQYRFDHDFAFPDRAGSIARFSLDLILDPVWQPLSDVRARYTAGPLAPGRSFVLTIPLRYSGKGAPTAIDARRPPEIVLAVAAILGGFAIGVVAFFVRERLLGRFARVPTADIGSTWIEQEILSHPAEVIGAIWDDTIGAPEVVALIARMTGEGKLESETGPSSSSAQAGGSSMTLRLKVDRSALDGHERALVDGLFFDGRTETSTTAVHQHYKDKGFDPALAITPALGKRVQSVLPPGESRVYWGPTVLMFLAGAGLLAWTGSFERDLLPAAIVLVFPLVFGGFLLQVPGWLFRTRMDWSVPAAMACLVPAFLLSLGTAAFLWMIVGTGRLELPWEMIAGIAAWTLCISNASINGLKSRQNPEVIAFRKRVIAGRWFFSNELKKPNPALRDSWYPWLLAFGLGKQVDLWSTRNARGTTRSSTWERNTNSSPDSNASPDTASADNAWTGGGRSGGAGGGATWAAGAAGMAAGVSAPSSSSSGGGSDGSSSSGSSSGGSSGGGGGGGW